MKIKTRGVFLLFSLLTALLSGLPAFGAATHRWVWNVPVVPPAGGWEVEPGKSLRAALTWLEAEIEESGGGVGGHDIQFVHLPELNENTVEGFSLPIDAHTAAVMSFAGGEVDAALAERMAGGQVPLFLAGGEEILIDQGWGPAANLFALDLYRDYRCQAFTLYAAKQLQPNAYVALAAGRFTVNQEREAKICYTLLDRAGLRPLTLWADASVRDSFSMLSREIESAADGVVISFLGGMGAKELWRGFMRVRPDWRLWNCAAPDGTYLSFRGMIFADQNLFLPQEGKFLALKNRMWRTRALRIDDMVMAGRAEALVEWLKQGISALPQPVDDLDRPALLRALERVRNIPFGDQKLDIAPELHRPRARQVYIAEVRDRKWALLDTLFTPGLPYVPSY